MPKKSAAQPEPAPEKRGVSFWIKLFVLIHLIAITSWSLPDVQKDVASGQRKLTVDSQGFVSSFTDWRHPANAVRAAGVLGRQMGGYISDGTLLVNERYVKTSPLKYYTLSTGFWQYWDMFSPNPASIDFYGTATITYQNGSTILYHYPRMYELSIPAKYVNERYRKFYERAHTEDDRYMWPVFAQRIALKNFTDPNNPPVRVVLTRHWLPIAAPGKPQQEDYNSYNYYTYTVDQKQMRKDKAGGIFG